MMAEDAPRASTPSSPSATGLDRALSVAPILRPGARHLQPELLHLAGGRLGDLGEQDGARAFETRRGARRHQAISSSAETLSPGLSSTKAHGVSPISSSGFATTAASCTAGCLKSASSTSIEEMFSPPEMMMSLERSFSWM